MWKERFNEIIVSGPKLLNDNFNTFNISNVLYSLIKRIYIRNFAGKLLEDGTNFSTHFLERGNFTYIRIKSRISVAM